MSPPDLPCHCAAKGFSLVELLAVIAIVAIMMGLMVSGVGGFGGSSARKSAVTLVMNTFEQARAAAIETGQSVYVGFADADFPVEDMRFAAFIVFRLFPKICG